MSNLFKVENGFKVERTLKNIFVLFFFFHFPHRHNHKHLKRKISFDKEENNKAHGN